MTSASTMAQDDPSLEDRIRERAYELWVEAGQQDGRADEFWYQAEQEILGPADGSGEAMASVDDGSAVDQIVEDYTGGQSGAMDEAMDASLASDDGVATPAAETPKRTRKAPAKASAAPAKAAKAPAKTKTAPEVASLDAAAEKPRRGRRPVAPA